MEKSKSVICSTTKQKVILCKWIPENPKAIVQIIHGMAEHIERYDEFASFLANHGYAVVGANHPGHGETVEVKGYFAKEDGWQKVLDDIHHIRIDMQKEFPNIPYFMFGHSMGSFLLRSYLQEHCCGITGAVISGTGYQAPALVHIGSLIAHTQVLFGGDKKPSHLLNNMSFKAFNKTVANPKTDFDWLSRDEHEVDKYIADPYCGFPFTAGGFKDFFSGLKRIANEKGYKNTCKTTPLFFVSGTCDPVGNMGCGVKCVFGHYKKLGFQNASYKLYEGARHEILNEINRQEVFGDILQFLENIVC